jgi:hypothetical protein
MFPEKLRPFGIGISFAFGMGDGPMGRIASTAPAASPEAKNAAYLAELQHRLNQMAEYIFLRGPRPEDIAAMPDYDPSATAAIAQARADREQELMELLAAGPTYQPSLDDIVHARGLYWELGPRLPELLSMANLSVDSFFARGRVWIADFLDDLPLLAVQTALTLRTDKNGNRAWSPNDMHDIDSLAAAVPYCDVVATERYACDVMSRSGLAARYGTTVVRRLSELETVLDELA